MKLKTKILIPTVGLIALSIIVSTVISYISVKETIFHLSEAQLKAIVTSAGERLDDQFAALMAEAEKLAEYKDVEKATRYKGLRSKATAFFADYAADRSYFETLVLADASGIAVASSTESLVGNLDISKSAFFESAMAGKIGVSPVQKSQISGSAVFTISVPVMMNKKVEGVMLAQVSLSFLGDKFIKPMKAGKTGYGYLISDKGLVIYHPDAGKRLTLDLSSSDFGKRMLAEKEGFIESREDGRDWLVGFSRSNSPAGPWPWPPTPMS